MQKLHINQPSGFWLVLSAAILWGTIGIATQAIFSLDNTNSLFINLTRMLITTPVLLIASWRIVGKTMFHIRRRDFMIMVLAGIMLAISQSTYFAAIRLAGVTIPTLLAICVAPIVVTCVSVVLKFETLTWQIVLALICAIVGSILLVGIQSPDETNTNLLTGTIFSLIAAVTYAMMIVCGRFLASGYHPLQVTTVTFAAGTVVLIIVNLINGIVLVQSAQGWLLVLYLGLVPTAFAYWLFQMGLRSVSATVASIISMVDPLVAGILAWILFGERLASSGIIGAILMCLSIFLLSLDKQA